MNAYFGYLIEIGTKGCVPDINEMSNKELLNRVFLKDGWEALNDEDLLKLFKGLVILEEYWYINGEHIGSTTDTKFVYLEIRARHLDEDYSLGNWSFIYSSNPYVPLDSGNRHGAQTIYEYLQWQNDYRERTINEKEDSTIREEEKKRLKAEAHLKRKIEEKKNEEEIIEQKGKLEQEQIELENLNNNVDYVTNHILGYTYKRSRSLMLFIVLFLDVVCICNFSHLVSKVGDIFGFSSDFIINEYENLSIMKFLLISAIIAYFIGLIIAFFLDLVFYPTSFLFYKRKIRIWYKNNPETSFINVTKAYTFKYHLRISPSIVDSFVNLSDT